MNTSVGRPTGGSDSSGVTGSGRTLLSGALWNGLNSTLPQAYTLIQSVVAARILGPTLMGRQSYIAWVAMSVTMLATGGVPLALLRSVSESIGRGRPGVARALVGWAFRVELVGALVGGGVVVGIGLGMSTFKNAWFLAAVVCLLTTLHTVPYGVLSGIQRFRDTATIGLTLGGLGTLGTVTVLVAGAGITGMFAVEAVIAAASLVWTTARARRAFASIAPSVEPDPDARREFNSYARITSVLVILDVVVWKRSEFLFLERYAAAAELALYSVAFAAASAIARLPQGMASVLSPAIASLYGERAFDRIRIGFGRAVRVVATASLPITAGTLAVGPPLLRAVYGDRYERSGTVLSILMLTFPIVPLGSVGTSLVFGFGRVRAALTAVLLAAVVDIALAVTLIPEHGAVGAAIANSAGQLTAGAAILFVAIRLAGPIRLELATLARAATASAVTGLVAYAAVRAIGGVPGAAVGVVLGGVTFPVLLVVLRGLAEEDAVWLRDNVGERLGGRVGRFADRFIDG